MPSPSSRMPIGRGRIETSTVVHSLVHTVQQYPDRLAIVHPARSLTYADLSWTVSGLAALVSRSRRDVGPVALVMPNSPEMTAALFAVWSLGAQVALLNPNYTAHELEPLLEQAEPSLIIAVEGQNEVVASVARAAGTPCLTIGPKHLDGWLAQATDSHAPIELPLPNQLATLMFTGGTTGVPKGVNHTHQSLMMTVQGMEASWPTAMGRETWLNVAPMFHIWGLLMGALNPVFGAATLIMVPRFDPKTVVASFEEHGVTVFAGGPAEIYAGLLAAPNFKTSDLSRLRICPGGGSRFSPALLDRWRIATGTPIYEAFGMTELAPISCNPSGREPRPGTVGTAAPMVEIKIVDLVNADALPVGDIGEIAVRAPHLTVGYHRMPDSEQRTPDGWFLTGDIGCLDSEGYLSILDRKKEMLIVGGFNVYPREIDETLLGHPAVLEAATIGVPDPRKGERPVTFVALDEQHSTDRGELLNYCTENLIAYKQPIDVLVVPGMPRTPANKIDRMELRRYWDSPGSTDS